MKKIIIWIFISIVLVILAIVAVFLWPVWFSGNDMSYGPQENIVVTEENFGNYLAATNLVSDLPSDANILLKTEKKTYSVSKGSVFEGNPTNPDLTITIPSKYVPMISNGFCNTMQTAYNNGDLGIDLGISSASAAFKYRALLKYKSCLGL